MGEGTKDKVGLLWWKAVGRGELVLRGCKRMRGATLVREKKFC